MEEPGFVLWDKHPLITLVRFADVEASGLHEGSYPLQFGWCGLDLKPSVVLVRPESEWTSQLFDPKAFEMHGISHERAMREGIDATEAAKVLNVALTGKAVVTDNVQWDGYWTTRLADTTGVGIRFGYNPSGLLASTFRSVFDPWCVAREPELRDVVDVFYPHVHLADLDALRMAALMRMLIDRQWAEWLLDRPFLAPLSGSGTKPHTL